MRLASLAQREPLQPAAPDAAANLHAECGAAGLDETRDPFNASALPMLANELDANGLAGAPDDFAVAPRPGVARECQPEAGRQHDGLIRRHLAPVADKSPTMHCRVAKPPSKVIHPGWRSDLRGSCGFSSASIYLLQRAFRESGYRFANSTR
jgi:hypothetical protein